MYKIVIRMPNWLGDAVMATPVIADIRHRWPNAKITAISKGAVSKVLDNNPYIDENITFSADKVDGRKQVIEGLRRGKYDLGILLTNSFSSAWWFWLGKVKRRLGYTVNLRSFLLSDKVRFSTLREKQHLVVTYKQLLEPLGISNSVTKPSLYISDDELKNAKSLLGDYGIAETDCIIGVNPSAAYGEAKCWLPNRFKNVTKKIIEDPRCKIIYFGDSKGVPLVRDITSELGSQVVNLAGKTSLREFMALIKLCDVFLTNDSGPMHLAAALGTPLVALFGSTSDIATGPYSDNVKVIHKRVSCSPCYLRQCPKDFRCMTEITEEEVQEAVLSLVEKGFNDIDRV